jgi:hypothetical protein
MSKALFTRSIRGGLFVDCARLCARLEEGRWLLETVFESRVQPADVSLESLTPMFDHLPSIHHQLGLWCPKGCSTSNVPRAVSADPLHVWMSS